MVTHLRSDAGIVETLLLSNGGDNGDNSDRGNGTSNGGQNGGGGNVRVLAVGQDHGSDYCCPYPPSEAEAGTTPAGTIHLCFNRHSGYGGYDRTTYPGFGGNWTRGGRVYQLELTVGPQSDCDGGGRDGGVDGAKRDPTPSYRFSWRSWARLADGSRVSEVEGT